MKKIYRAGKPWIIVVSSFFLASLLLVASPRGDALFAQNRDKKEHGHGMHEPRAGGMKHTVKVIPADYENPPSVKIRLERDAHSRGALNLFLDLENFRFAPEEVNKTSRIKEGHAHLYVNGKKITRLYGSSHFMDNLPKGNLKIRVVLNTNLHENLRYRGNLVQDVVEFRGFHN